MPTSPEFPRTAAAIPETRLHLISVDIWPFRQHNGDTTPLTRFQRWEEVERADLVELVQEADLRNIALLTTYTMLEIEAAQHR